MSFSGRRSLAVVEQFRDWLLAVLDETPDFSFSPDFPKGEAWDARLDRELNKCQAALVFVNKVNAVSPWLNYEVGAVSRDNRKVFVVVFDDSQTTSLPPTLSRFQVTRLVKDDVLRLLIDLHTLMGRDIDNAVHARFKMTWPPLEKGLREALARESAVYEGETERTPYVTAPVFRSHRFAEIPRRLSQAKRQIDILQTFIPDYRTVVDCLEDAVVAGCHVRLLLLDPTSRYLAVRLRTLNRPATEGEISLHAMEELRQRTENALGSVQIRTYDSVPHFPYYCVDGEAFVGFFLAEGSFVHPQVLFTKNTFPRVFEHFEQSWAAAPDRGRAVSLVSDLRMADLPGELLGRSRRDTVRDASLYQGRPVAYVELPAEQSPERTGESIRQILHIARTHDVPLTVVGARTSVAGQATNRDGLLVDMRARKRFTPKAAVENPYVRVDSGVVLDDLNAQMHKIAVPILFEHTLDLSSSHMATIGGTIMNNGGGILSHKYGSAKQVVKDLEVVIPGFQDRLLWTSTIPREHPDIYSAVESILRDADVEQIVRAYQTIPAKNSTGYNIEPLAEALQRNETMDLTQLFVGSEGTLGVLIQAELWVREYQPPQETALLFFASPHDVTPVVQALVEGQSRELWPSAVEVISGSILSLITELGSLGELGAIPQECWPPEGLAGAMLLVEFDGPRERAAGFCDELIARHEAAVRSRGLSVKSWHRSDDDDVRARLWFLRKNIVRIVNGYAEKHHLVAPPIIEDVAVPVDQLGRLVEYLEGLFRLPHMGRHAAIFGHAASGNLHVRPLFSRDQQGMEQARYMMNLVYDQVLGMGGTVSGEHGDGLLRTPFLEKRYPPSVIDAFERIKRLMDPEFLLNPGVKVRCARIADAVYDDWVVDGYLPMGGGLSGYGDVERLRQGQGSSS